MSLYSDILVVGAGPAGLSFAAELAGSGLKVTLIEKSPLEVLQNPPYDGREIALTHLSREIMQRLGMWDLIPKDEIYPLRDAKVLNGQSDYQLHFPQPTQARGEPADCLGYLISNHNIRKAAYENENREELVITEHPKSQLLFVSADWRPMAEVVFTKEKGKEKENLTVNLEEFISVKGIKALGNQLTTDKVKTINTLESLPYEEPQEEELVEEDLGDEEIVPTPENDNNGTQTELEF